MKRPQLQRIISILVPCIFGWAFLFLGTNIFGDYGWTLFLFLPFCLGMISTLIYAHKNNLTHVQLRNNSYLTLSIFCLGLFLFAWEGLICLAMVAPFAIACSYIGFVIGSAIARKYNPGNTPTLVIILLLSIPSLMAFENQNPGPDKIRFVTTSIEISATPEDVWKNVIKFPELEKPTEFIFRAGIAYPTNATITGNGVGATRYCNFSTGQFVEPIIVWDEPRLLKFSVEQQPDPMEEISFYNLHPNHLKGYWVSKEGQFKLTTLENGNTLLEGTTWYVNKIRPGFYWTLWSDFIVHKIHRRVLTHIKKVSER
jgi:hypothetical protein